MQRNHSTLDYTIKGTEDPVSIVMLSCLGARWRCRWNETPQTDVSYLLVLGADDAVIGYAHRGCYGTRGWSLWTEPFAGFVANDEIQMVEAQS